MANLSQLNDTIALSDEEVALLCEIVVAAPTIDVAAVVSAREERLRKDRLRKRRSKERSQLELEQLKGHVADLERTLSRKRKGRCKSNSSASWQEAAAAAKSDATAALKVQRRLQHELVEQLERAVSYLSWLPSASPCKMAIHPKTQPWILHTLQRDPKARSHAAQAMMEHQQRLFTPSMYGKLPSSPAGGPFSLVLAADHDCRLPGSTNIAYLEMAKFGRLRAPFRQVAMAFWTMVTKPTLTRQITNFGNDLVLVTSLAAAGGAVRRHALVKLIHENHRVVFLQRTVSQDEACPSYASDVHIAAFWVFESDGDGVAQVRGYTQVGLDGGDNAKYTAYMNESTINNATLNALLGQFDCIVLN
ncbi:hypothetical protein SPRG_06487 [Saprolegnia parasitica CBS 223.65]|uniref:Uncharacterized protein n=1 Tax=Saprolegnia parasitica (strain CBS 223.65) TaxID=695850 RepID=A0A067CPA5_SAPPC|nr:hypothetical protein SPRG_06487 [Saprolegnia parasitica CBS 223.65]KDO28632.1 hypothetical protein SPRG_06487 [Saprolegnia parasitica CBS 223.65]|eukprot:XP_012200694.1 hypothetical protein SPRG_06487 [Saprolegnia parasitica CBS 223.65]